MTPVFWNVMSCEQSNVLQSACSQSCNCVGDSHIHFCYPTFHIPAVLFQCQEEHWCTFCHGRSFCMCLASWQPVFLISLHPTFWLSLDCSFFSIVSVHSVCFLFCAFLMYVIFRNTAPMCNESCLCIPRNVSELVLYYTVSLFHVIVFSHCHEKS